MGDLLHREQSVGEIRGLERMERALFDRKRELEEKLGLVKKDDTTIQFENEGRMT